jgi:hypothetical protein
MSTATVAHDQPFDKAFGSDNCEASARWLARHDPSLLEIIEQQCAAHCARMLKIIAFCCDRDDFGLAEAQRRAVSDDPGTVLVAQISLLLARLQAQAPLDARGFQNLLSLVTAIYLRSVRP